MACGKSLKPMLGWSDLLPDLLVDIAKLVLKSENAEDYTLFGGNSSSWPEDFVAFAGVCRSWRAAAKHDECLSLAKPWPPMLPFLMLSEKEGKWTERRLYSLSKQKVSMRLPIPDGKDKRCIDSGFGWLLTVGYEKGEADLLNPFTGAQIQLPNVKTMPEKTYNTIRRSVLSANPSETSDSYVLVVLTEKYLAYWKPGEKNWPKINTRDSEELYDVNHRKGKFYSISRNKDSTKLIVRVWNPAGADTTKAQKILVFLNHYKDAKDWFLISVGHGKFLLVAHIIRHSVSGDWTTKFKVLWLQLKHPRICIIMRLCCAIFVSQNGALRFKLPPGAPHINCIYYTGTKDDARIEAGTDTGVYNLQDGSIQRFPHVDDESTFSFNCPPLWLAPSPCSPASMLSRN